MRWLFRYSLDVLFHLLSGRADHHDVLGESIAVLIASVSQRAAFPQCGTIWAWCLAWLSPVWVRVEGRENTRPEQSYVILTNHQGDYDILALYGYFLHRQFRWVIKQEAAQESPSSAGAAPPSGHIFVDPPQLPSRHRQPRSRQAASRRRSLRPLLPGRHPQPRRPSRSHLQKRRLRHGPPTRLPHPPRLPLRLLEDHSQRLPLPRARASSASASTRRSIRPIFSC